MVEAVLSFKQLCNTNENVFQVSKVQVHNRLDPLAMKTLLVQEAKSRRQPRVCCRLLLSLTPRAATEAPFFGTTSTSYVYSFSLRSSAHADRFSFPRASVLCDPKEFGLLPGETGEPMQLVEIHIQSGSQKA